MKKLLWIEKYATSLLLWLLQCVVSILLKRGKSKLSHKLIIEYVDLSTTVSCQNIHYSYYLYYETQHLYQIPSAIGFSYGLQLSTIAIWLKQKLEFSHAKLLALLIDFISQPKPSSCLISLIYQVVQSALTINLSNLLQPYTFAIHCTYMILISLICIYFSYGLEMCTLQTALCFSYYFNYGISYAFSYNFSCRVQLYASALGYSYRAQL